jgi:hypothetical protein
MGFGYEKINENPRSDSSPIPHLNSDIPRPPDQAARKGPGSSQPLTDHPHPLSKTKEGAGGICGDIVECTGVSPPIPLSSKEVSHPEVFVRSMTGELIRILWGREVKNFLKYSLAI